MIKKYFIAFILIILAFTSIWINFDRIKKIRLIQSNEDVSEATIKKDNEDNKELSNKHKSEDNSEAKSENFKLASRQETEQNEFQREFSKLIIAVLTNDKDYALEQLDIIKKYEFYDNNKKNFDLIDSYVNQVEKSSCEKIFPGNSSWLVWMNSFLTICEKKDDLVDNSVIKNVLVELVDTYYNKVSNSSSGEKK